MRVLVDYHHHDLWESMELLAKRLGWDLFRPIGMEWWDEGYNNHERLYRTAHNIQPIDGVARQYLEPWGSDEPADWHHLDDPRAYDCSRRLDKSHQRWQTLLTLDQARDLKPDIVISSLAHNHEGFARFASEVGATFGLQIGNVRFAAQDMAEDRWDLAAFGLVSGLMPVEPPKPHVVYHQEFSLRDFHYSPPFRGKWGERFTVSSFVQCYPQDTAAYAYWQATAPQLPEMAWRVFGAYGDAPKDEYAAGNIDRCSSVAAWMVNSDVAWHAKRWSDGFGHVIHNWFSVGRPVIGFRDYYKDQLAGRLWLEGETAWDIESNDIPALLRRFRDDEEFHLRACEASAARFRSVVDFDEEEQQIRALLSQVLP